MQTKLSHTTINHSRSTKQRTTSSFRSKQLSKSAPAAHKHCPVSQCPPTTSRCGKRKEEGRTNPKPAQSKMKPSAPKTPSLDIQGSTLVGGWNDSFAYLVLALTCRHVLPENRRLFRDPTASQQSLEVLWLAEQWATHPPWSVKDWVIGWNLWLWTRKSVFWAWPIHPLLSLSLSPLLSLLSSPYGFYTSRHPLLSFTFLLTSSPRRSFTHTPSGPSHSLIHLVVRCNSSCILFS